ncbi:hypothetical protein E8E11_003980 [Didymella keratinophila]|nr:hypothetical protein E8E11_003980 [Didymella keratinophila]
MPPRQSKKVDWRAKLPSTGTAVGIETINNASSLAMAKQTPQLLKSSTRPLRRKVSTTDIAPDHKRRRSTLVDMSDYRDDDHEEDDKAPNTPLLN